MVRRFVIECALLALPIVVVLSIWLWFQRAFIPAPMVTNNIALNAQLEAFRTRADEQVDVLAIGSSNALNNLSSEAVLEHFGPVTYRNTGAWGLDLHRLADLAPVLVDRSRPKVVLLPCNLMDLDGSAHVLDMDSAEVARALDQEHGWVNYLTHWNAPWYLRQVRLQRIRLRDPGNYEYLGFDAHGAAPLEVPPDRIEPLRNAQRPPRQAELDTASYGSLRELARMLRGQGTDLFVLALPYREGVMDDGAERTMQAHVERMREVVGPYGHRVLDATDRRWPDSLFADAGHLNKPGALQVSRYLLRQASDR